MRTNGSSKVGRKSVASSDINRLWRKALRFSALRFYALGAL